MNVDDQREVVRFFVAECHGTAGMHPHDVALLIADSMEEVVNPLTEPCEVLNVALRRGDHDGYIAGLLGYR